MLDHVLHRVHNLNRVAARDAQDVQIDGVLPVDRDGLGRRRPAIFDPRDVADEHRLVAGDLHRRVAHSLHALRDGVRVNVGVEVGRYELARRQERVRVAHCLGDVGCREVSRLCRNRVDNDVDLPHPAAVGGCAGDPRDAFKERLDVVECVVVELRARVALPRDDDLDDRCVGWVVLQDERWQNAQ